MKFTDIGFLKPIDNRIEAVVNGSNDGIPRFVNIGDWYKSDCA